MVRPKKPASLKVIAATARYDGERPEAEDNADVVVGMEIKDLTHALPPSWLPNTHAVDEWRRLAPMLVGSGVLTKGGLSALGVLCALHGEIVQLYAAGKAPPTSMVGIWRSFANDFGLTPAAQRNVKGVGSPATPPANPFARNGIRPSSLV